MDFEAEKIDLRNVRFTPELLRCMPASVARRHRALPVADSPHGLCIDLADVTDFEVIDSLSHILKRELELCGADARQLEEFIERLYRNERK
jgi:hypothetical protein